MPRFIVKDAGISEARRYRVIDTHKMGDAALILRTQNRADADGLARDYNDRFAPPLHIRLARLFGFCQPRPQVIEQPWQAKIRRINERIEAKKKERVA